MLAPSAPPRAFLHESRPSLHASRPQQHISSCVAVAAAAGGVACGRRSLKASLGKAAAASRGGHAERKLRATGACQVASAREGEGQPPDELRRLRRRWPAYERADAVLVPAGPQSARAAPAEEEMVFCTVRGFLQEHLVGGASSGPGRHTWLSACVR
ncbi:unnamed protein product [Prorocentrum cordatum]|uniref:Uncharacterized protein n=1 Tax=Prorocentrum cordatum TaxID=2364126 RepID=A0ABN9WAY3_9DINO|nr:unnamed protein product [Polarella glacialis]